LNKGRNLAEGGIMLALYTILLFITLYVPFIGTVLMFVLPVPFALIALKQNLKWSFLFLAASVFINIILMFAAIPVTVMFGLIGITIGYYIQCNKSQLQMYIISVLIFIFGILSIFIGSIVLLDTNYIEETINMVESSLEQSDQMLTALGQDEGVTETISQNLELVQTIMPSFLVICSIIMVGIIFLVCKPIINRFSDKKLVIGKVRDMQLPKSLLWYYLIIMISSLFFSEEDGQLIYTFFVNGIYLLQFLILLQGFSFIFYFSNVKGWVKGIPITVVILSVLLPFAPFVRILGIIDLGFPLRKTLTGSNEE